MDAANGDTVWIGHWTNPHHHYAADAAADGDLYIGGEEYYSGNRNSLAVQRTDSLGHQRWWYDLECAMPAGPYYAELATIGGDRCVIATSVTAPGADSLDLQLLCMHPQGYALWDTTLNWGNSERVATVLADRDSAFFLAGTLLDSTGQYQAFLVRFRIDSVGDTTSTALPRGALPAEFELGVYPNPFNPATTLAFNLPQAQHVRLVVYDVSGREVAVVTNELLSGGSHTFTFDGSGLPSGLYFARLRAKQFHATQKLLLLK